MGLTTTEWWKKRFDARDGWFDVTKTWTARQRADETMRLWGMLWPHLDGTKRLVDFGCGLQRFREHILSAGMEYTGVDVLPEAIIMPLDLRCRGVLFDRKSPIPEEADGDSAIFGLVLQHLSDEDAKAALSATKAKRRVIFGGIWKSDSYSIARDLDAMEQLCWDCGANDTQGKLFNTELASYKVVAAKW